LIRQKGENKLKNKERIVSFRRFSPEFSDNLRKNAENLHFVNKSSGIGLLLRAKTMPY